MSDPLGCSIGSTNLVVARVGSQPVIRRSVVTVAGRTLSGFVDRVGDPVPLVAPGGVAHSADALIALAADQLIAAADAEADAPITVAVPAHWDGPALHGLRAAMRERPRLAPEGMPVRLVSDAVAALTALAANPGLPAHGVVVLLDVGGAGTTITLADAATGYQPIETIRLTEMGGDQLDQALLSHLLDSVTGGARTPGDAVGDLQATAAVDSLAALRERCRVAKEALSTDTVAQVAVELPEHRSVATITRDELDALLDAPLRGVLDKVEDALRRNGIVRSDVAAVAAVGGGANIPLIGTRVGERFGLPCLVSPKPVLDAAVGAALFAAYGTVSDADTGVAPVPLIADVAAQTAATTPVATADAATDAAPLPGLDTFVDTRANTAAGAAADSSAHRALAWSQDDDATADPVPYIGADPYASPYSFDTALTRAVSQHVPAPIPADEPRSWQRLPQLLFGFAAVIALVAVGGVAIALTSSTEQRSPAPAPATRTPSVTAPPSSAPVIATSPPAPAPPPPSPAPTVEPEPPPVTAEAPSVVTVTNPAPPPRTVTVAPPVTAVETPTTTVPTPTPTTIEPPVTTEPPVEQIPTSTAPPMTTSYITVPFVPVPIPVQVPSTPQPQPAYPQYPQYPQQQYPQQYYPQQQYAQVPQYPY